MPEAKPRTIENYLDENKESPFEAWMETLKGQQIHGRILNRLERVKKGLLGDWKAVGDGANEFRIEGYRVYFAFDGDKIILLCGGTKKGQQARIAAAKKNWSDYNA